MSADRIRCTHTGSLPRPDDLVQIMWAVGDGVRVDATALEARVKEAVTEVVGRQVAAGVSIVNDGEMSKPSYATYVKDRLTGFEGESVQSYNFNDLNDFPRSVELVQSNPGRRKRSAPACIAPIGVKDPDAAARDMEHLAAAFLKAIAHSELGLTKRDITHNINFFMNVPVTPTGGLSFEDGVSADGRYVEMRAEMDVLCLISNCPQLNNPCNAYNPTPVRLLIWD